MAYSIIVAGGVLYKITPDGVATPLALPADVRLSLTRPPRFAVLGRTVLVTNNPSRSLCVDQDFHVRPMQLASPVSPVTLSSTPVGNLTGAYKVLYTHIIKHPVTGALLAESDFSPPSQPVTLAAARLVAAGVSASPDTEATHHRLYRTLADGEVYYVWLDLDARQSSVEDDLSDVLLPNLTAPRELGVGPGRLAGSYMTLLVEWKNRLWGVGDREIDTLRYSGEGISYGWPATYGLDVKPIGADEFGITALIARKDLLGVAKRRSFWKVSGGLTDDDGVPQFDIQRESEGQGCVGPSIVVNDTAYYLGSDGVYSWGLRGFTCLSDGRVRKWFATDTYFNRELFPAGFVKYNERYNTIEFHLAAAGSTAIDRWVSLDVTSGAWYGPHKTARSTPTSGFVLVSTQSQALPVIGAADGTIYLQNQPGWSDAGVAINLRLRTKWHDGQTPTIEKVWGAVSLVSKALTTIGHCLVQYRVGALEAPVQQTIAVDQRMGTQTLPRVGTGEFLQLEITEDTNGGECELYGYEVPWYELSNRRRR